jgi:predicted nucleic acid-binding Zn ribbon protein
MANYYEKARSNYFKVKDAAKFQDFIEKFSGIDLVVQEQTGQYALLFDEECGIPTFYYDDDGNDVEVDFPDEVSQHLTDDSIAVFEAVGSEKIRYLNGYAIAVNGKGERVDINIAEIYERAKQKFGVNEINSASY